MRFNYFIKTIFYSKTKLQIRTIVKHPTPRYLTYYEYRIHNFDLYYIILLKYTVYYTI